MHCVKCGKAHSNEDLFCGNCGNDLRKKSNDTPSSVNTNQSWGGIGCFLAVGIVVWVIILINLGFDSHTKTRETGYVSSTAPKYVTYNESTMNTFGKIWVWGTVGGVVVFLFKPRKAK